MGGERPRTTMVMVRDGLLTMYEGGWGAVSGGWRRHRHRKWNEQHQADRLNCTLDVLVIAQLKSLGNLRSESDFKALSKRQKIKEPVDVQVQCSQ